MLRFPDGQLRELAEVDAFLYTTPVVNTPREIEREIPELRDLLRDFRQEPIRREETRQLSMLWTAFGFSGGPKGHGGKSAHSTKNQPPQKDVSLETKHEDHRHTRLEAHTSRTTARATTSRHSNKPMSRT